MQHRISALAFASLGSFAFAAVQTEPTKEQAEFFEGKIRPILAENCYKCHSAAEGKAKGGLTLDTREGTLKGGENGKAVVPGDVEKSMMITAIGYLDPDLQMPPKGEKLTKDQIALLTQWVKMGAPDPRKDDPGTKAKLSGLTDSARHHWAFQPVTQPPVPTPKNTLWPKTPVDAFILTKLEENKMVPAPDAEKGALLRRATYDLLGLPPTPQEVQAFIDDTSLQAFAKVIDRLLASPHYGERWGRFWLDTARYSDTAGGQTNNLKGADYRYAHAWTYRDWVVKAVNKDLPYDQFIIQQLAADKLPDNPPANLAALGFLTVGERFRNVNDVINDRIDVVGKGFLGLTVSCARCHDHMFDPIPTADYYALHGVFASTIEPVEKPIIAKSDPAHVVAFQKEVAAIEEKNRDLYYKLIDNIQSEVFGKIDSYLLAISMEGRRGKKGASEEELRASLALQSKADLEREYVALLVRGANNKYAKDKGSKERGSRDRKDRSERISPPTVYGPFHAFAALGKNEFAAKAPALAAEIAGGKSGRDMVNGLIAAAFHSAQPKSLDDVGAIYKNLFAKLEPRRKAFLAANAKALSEPVTGFSAEEIQIFNSPLAIMSASEAGTRQLRDFSGGLGNKTSKRTQFQFAKINELELTNPGAPARAMLVADAERVKDSPVFIRGQANVRGDIVPRRFLEILSPDRKAEPFKDGSGRLELAENIARKTNPLTARVMVNRVWMHHFGEGFVRTLDDLGTQSEAPSHPELLDYLSSYFMSQNWSLKKLHKLIMLSHVYQQSTRTQPAFETMDPENRLLWRANVRRLDFESMRDSLLVFAGNLDRTVGGQPINLTDEPYSNRRSAYGYIDRGNLPELMQNFDFSDPDMPNSKRTSTVVPQQALFFMNSPMAVDVARKIVARPEVAGAGDARGLLFGIYRVIFQRPPTPKETDLAYKFVIREEKCVESAPPATSSPQFSLGAKKHQSLGKMTPQQIARVEAAAKKKLAAKTNKRNSATSPIQNPGERVERKALSPWETYVQALLFSNEAAYVN